MTVRKREYEDKRGQQIWDYDFWHNGQRHRKAGFASKAEAQIAETKAKQLVYSGRPVLRPSTFADLAMPFLEHRKGRVAQNTWLRDERRMPTMIAFFGAKKLYVITSADVNRYVDLRIKAGMSARTINLEVNLLSSMFQYAISERYAYENPLKQVKRLKTVQVDQPIPSNEQLRALIDASFKTETGLELATWIIFRGYTGTRPAESFFAEWRDIDFANGLVMIRPKVGNPLKKGAMRAVPMHSELKSALLQWRAAWEQRFSGRKKPPHDWVFFSPRLPERRCQRFEKTYPRAQRLAGLTEHMTSHCLRHFFISRAVEAGINFLVIAKWVGHSSTKMIEQVYAHLSPQFKDGEMKKLQLGLGSGNGSTGAVRSEKSVDSSAA